VVAVGSPDDGTAPTCAAQEALQRVAMCLLEAGSAPPAPSVLRLLVPAAQARAARPPARCRALALCHRPRQHHIAGVRARWGLLGAAAVAVAHGAWQS